jgi:hypothetical protein
MPSVSEQQRELVFVKRNQYKSKKDTPEKWSWIWNDDWLKLKKENYIKKYIRFFTEMSPPNFSYINNSIEKEIDNSALRIRSDRENKEYHKAYRDLLQDYLDGDISPSDVADLSKENYDENDNYSKDEGKIVASQFIMKIVRKAIED